MLERKINFSFLSNKRASISIENMELQWLALYIVVDITKRRPGISYGETARGNMDSMLATELFKGINNI